MIRAAASSDASGHEEHHPGLDLTPLVDVIFILLTFFLLTAGHFEHALTVDLPREGADQAAPVTTPERITLTLFAEAARWAVNDQPFQEWTAVEQQVLRLRAERPDAEVVIAGDRQVPLERLLQALAFLQREGLRAAEILMESAPPKPLSSAIQP